MTLNSDNPRLIKLFQKKIFQSLDFAQSARLLCVKSGSLRLVCVVDRTSSCSRKNKTKALSEITSSFYKTQVQSSLSISINVPIFFRLTDREKRPTYFLRAQYYILKR